MQQSFQALKLNSGFSMPILGLGTSRVTDIKTILTKAVLEHGYRHIDTAKCYNNEKEIGEALHDVMQAGIKREDLFVVSKLFETDKNDIEAALDGQLKDLQVDYLDLYLIHWMWPDIDFSNGGIKVLSPPIHVIWKKMEELVKKGKVRSIGISNGTVPLILDMMTYAEILPAIN